MRKILCLPVLGVLVSLAAFADPPAAANPNSITVAKGTPMNPQEVARMCMQGYDMQRGRTGMLETSLKLTPEQQPVFDAWRKVRDAQWKAVPCPGLPVGLKIPAPQRLSNQITMLSAELDGLRKEQPATDALYKALTPEQRVIFDGPVRMPPPPAAPNGATQELPPILH